VHDDTTVPSAGVSEGAIDAQQVTAPQLPSLVEDVTRTAQAYQALAALREQYPELNLPTTEPVRCSGLLMLIILSA
jgi:hypothetical protein